MSPSELLAENERLRDALNLVSLECPFCFGSGKMYTNYQPDFPSTWFETITCDVCLGCGRVPKMVFP